MKCTNSTSHNSTVMLGMTRDLPRLRNVHRAEYSVKKAELTMAAMLRSACSTFHGIHTFLLVPPSPVERHVLVRNYDPRQFGMSRPADNLLWRLSVVSLACRSYYHEFCHHRHRNLRCVVAIAACYVLMGTGILISNIALIVRYLRARPGSLERKYSYSGTFNLLCVGLLGLAAALLWAGAPTDSGIELSPFLGVLAVSFVPAAVVVLLWYLFRPVASHGGNTPL
jgi:hypothetical protein